MFFFKLEKKSRYLCNREEVTAAAAAKEEEV